MYYVSVNNIVSIKKWYWIDKMNIFTNYQCYYKIDNTSIIIIINVKNHTYTVNMFTIFIF